MIVRCNNCNSAFAVDDAKVDNKKFAFSCPKCSTENVIDNTLAELSAATKKTEQLAEESTGIESGAADLSYEDSSSKKNDNDLLEETPSEEDFDISLSDGTIQDDGKDIEDDTIIDIPDTEAALITEDQTTEIDEFPDIDVDNNIVETVDLDEELSSGDIIADDSQPDTVPVSKIENDLIDGTIDPGKDEVDSVLDEIGDLDDFQPVEEELPVTPDEELVSASDDLSLDEVSIDEIQPDQVVTEIDETADSKEDEDNITVDIDSLDLDFEDGDEDILPEDDNLVTDAAKPVDEEFPVELNDDEDVTLDIDSLDLDLVEDSDFSTGIESDADESMPIMPDELPDEDGLVDSGEDESTTLDLDSLDLDLVEDKNVSVGVEPVFDDEMPIIADDLPEEQEIGSLNDEDESVTLDLDSLDLDLVEDEGETALVTNDFPDEQKIDSLDEKDESITIDLDSLDIQLAETAVEKEGEAIDEDEKLTLEDTGLTFDELTSEEIASATLLPGDHKDVIDEDDEEDIRITIDEIDPNLNMDDLEVDLSETDDSEIDTVKTAATEEEDISDFDLESDIDLLEIDTNEEKYPELELDEKGKLEPDIELEEFEEMDLDIFDEDMPDFDISTDEELNEIKLREESDDIRELSLVSDDDLPEINLDDYDDEIVSDKKAASGIAKVTDDIIGIEEDIELVIGKKRKYIPENRGAVSFSIDYSLAYSRLGAFLRLFGIFVIGLIPHFAVFFVYTSLSAILGMLNHIVIMTTGKAVMDFQSILENTLRYYLSISASMLGIVEEFPVFAGKDDIDYSLQLNITYSLRSSALLAALRLSMVGIIIITLPHLIILSLLTISLPVVFLIGTFSVLFTRRWPHFLFDFMTSYYRSLSKVMAFIIGLVDKYPPFKFG